MFILHQPLLFNMMVPQSIIYSNSYFNFILWIIMNHHELSWAILLEWVLVRKILLQQSSLLFPFPPYQPHHSQHYSHSRQRQKYYHNHKNRTVTVATARASPRTGATQHRTVSTNSRTHKVPSFLALAPAVEEYVLRRASAETLGIVEGRVA